MCVCVCVRVINFLSWFYNFFACVCACVLVELLWVAFALILLFALCLLGVPSYSETRERARWWRRPPRASSTWGWAPARRRPTTSTSRLRRRRRRHAPRLTFSTSCLTSRWASVWFPSPLTAGFDCCNKKITVAQTTACLCITHSHTFSHLFVKSLGCQSRMPHQ